MLYSWVCHQISNFLQTGASVDNEDVVRRVVPPSRYFGVNAVGIGLFMYLYVFIYYITVQRHYKFDRVKVDKRTKT